MNPSNRPRSLLLLINQFDRECPSYDPVAKLETLVECEFGPSAVTRQ
jgi:hypothetical protein